MTLSKLIFNSFQKSQETVRRVNNFNLADPIFNVPKKVELLLGADVRRYFPRQPNEEYRLLHSGFHIRLS